MSGPQDWPSAFVTAAMGVAAAVWWAVRKLFVSVTRKELSEELAMMRADRQRMHDENLRHMDQLRGDIKEVRARVDAIYTNTRN
ncbi:MAG: hypothetical protein JSR67_03605 [Proteobacteria bacterium]|nr:hypothetical protein [Pseudomonadota bacterium]